MLTFMAVKQVEYILKKGKKKVKLWFILPVILLLLAVVTSGILAKFVSEGPPVVTLTAPPASRMGIDYYHESMGYIKRTDAEIVSDLWQIQTVTHRLKVYHNPFGHASLSYVAHMVQIAKAQKMYVVWTENDDSVTLTNANWSEYADNVVADAAVARSSGADEFLVGNELSLHNNGDSGYNDNQLPAHVKQLVIDCQANFPGPKGYEEGWFKSGSWKNASLGPLNKIYFTLYEPWHTFTTEFDQILAYFGQRAEIGELSTMTTKDQLHYSEQDWTRELMRRYDYARQKGLAIWLFSFRETTNNGFGLFQSTPPTASHAIWDYLQGSKTLTYHTLLDASKTQQSFQGSGQVHDNKLQTGGFGAQMLANVSATSYVFRGIVIPITASGPDKWRAMRLLLSYSDADNYYFVNIEPNDNRIQLVRRQNGAEVVLGEESTPIQLGTEYDFEIRADGSISAMTLQVFWNTVKVIDVTDAQGSLPRTGKIGVENNGVAGGLSSILVTDFELVSETQ
jgi:hypothetical protein